MLKWPADSSQMWMLVVLVSAAVYGLGSFAIRRARHAEREDDGPRGKAAGGELKRWTVLLVAYSTTAAVTMLGPTVMFGVLDVLGYRSIDQTTLFIWTMAAFVGLVGVGGMVWWWRGDRSRGRRRCPKCWYDMTGVPKGAGEKEGWTCPECGRLARVERRLLKTRRRRWKLAISAMFIFAAISGIIGPVIIEGDWGKLVPTTALIVMMPYLKDNSDLLHLLGERLGMTYGLANGSPQSSGLPDWQTWLLRNRAISMFEGENDSEVVMRGLYVFRLVAPTTEESVERVRPFLTHTDPGVRVAAFSIFASHNGNYAEVERVGLAVLSEAQTYEGVRIVWGLGEAASREAAPPPPPPELLQAAIDHPSEWTRVAVCRVMNKFARTPESMKTLGKCLLVPGETREQAMSTLLEMDGGRAIAEPMLLEWLSGDDTHLVQHAGWAILRYANTSPWLMEHFDKVPAAAQRLADDQKWSAHEENGIDWAFDQYYIWQYDKPALERYMQTCLRYPALVPRVRKVLEDMGRSDEIAGKFRVALETLGDSPEDIAARQAILAELKTLEPNGAAGEPLTTPSAVP